ncbi:uncharacterized protein A4U43_C10F12680 [Asparagus officinalis]|uniref:Leucine-rich repeat-containing N-terminal plant-type domain-containing protein n=1 Tax=Asparagus officinalis TaxID=4686 RepID=A0A5P1E6Y6_ASPOF|nr:uncharacterized protein A4U43_C10F12680 [Asparagus officinalis]
MLISSRIDFFLFQDVVGIMEKLSECIVQRGANLHSIDVSSPRTSTSSTQEGNILLELRFTLNAVGNQLGDWNQDQVNPCIWNSVSCDNNQNVVTLTLAYMGFTGKLSSSLGELKHLKVL